MIFNIDQNEQLKRLVNRKYLKIILPNIFFQSQFIKQCSIIILIKDFKIIHKKQRILLWSLVQGKKTSILKKMPISLIVKPFFEVLSI